MFGVQWRIGMTQTKVDRLVEILEKSINSKYTFMKLNNTGVDRRFVTFHSCIPKTRIISCMVQFKNAFNSTFFEDTAIKQSIFRMSYWCSGIMHQVNYRDKL